MSQRYRKRNDPTGADEPLPIDARDRFGLGADIERLPRFRGADQAVGLLVEGIHGAQGVRLLSFRKVFVDRGENVLLKGGSGLGKTMIAQNLAQAALAAGFTVRFSTLAAALADLLGQESMPAFERRLRRYTSPDVLLLDELGYLPCDSRAADILYNIISRRHEQRSTIITTNLAFKQWGNTFPGAACVVALVDRFAQHCHRIEILGESWRDKHRLDPDRPPPKPSRSRRKRP